MRQLFHTTGESICNYFMITIQSQTGGVIRGLWLNIYLVRQERQNLSFWLRKCGFKSIPFKMTKK